MERRQGIFFPLAAILAEWGEEGARGVTHLLVVQREIVPTIYVQGCKGRCRFRQGGPEGRDLSRRDHLPGLTGSRRRREETLRLVHTTAARHCHFPTRHHRKSKFGDEEKKRKKKKHIDVKKNLSRQGIRTNTNFIIWQRPLSSSSASSGRWYMTRLKPASSVLSPTSSASRGSPKNEPFAQCDK